MASCGTCVLAAQHPCHCIADHDAARADCLARPAQVTHSPPVVHPAPSSPSNPGVTGITSAWNQKQARTRPLLKKTTAC